MTTSPRMTPQTVALLEQFLREPDEPRYGLDLAEATGLKTGTVHPILKRLGAAGWLASHWEETADDEPRPRRRYYRLTAEGIRPAQAAVAAAAPDGRTVTASRLGRVTG